MQFDPTRNAKSSEALKGTSPKPGKKVKPKVTGTMENNSTVKVASVDVTGRGKWAKESR